MSESVICKHNLKPLFGRPGPPGLNCTSAAAPSQQQTVACGLRRFKSIATYDTTCPYGDQVSLNNTKRNTFFNSVISSPYFLIICYSKSHHSINNSMAILSLKQFAVIHTNGQPLYHSTYIGVQPCFTQPYVICDFMLQTLLNWAESRLQLQSWVSNNFF